MNEFEIRMRCLEAAAKAPIVHNDGPAAGVLAVAQAWEAWVSARHLEPYADAYWNDMAAERTPGRPVLTAPGKK